MKNALTMAAVLLICLTNAIAQTVTGPGGRNKPGFVYDSARKKFVLFGGFGAKRGEGIKSDTWQWDGKRWEQVLINGPTPRGALGMTYDSRRRRVVLFGGVSGTELLLADTWEWDGKRWQQIAATGPSARSVPQMVYDSRRQKVVLFGGLDEKSRQPLGDTWEWDGIKWTEVSSTGPSPRFHHFMVYDSVRGKIVLFGGNQSLTPPPASGLLGDTWEWDGKEWTKVSDAGPLKRDHHAMSYDSKRGRTVLFGGWNKDYLGDTWEWDGKEWLEIKSKGPSERGGVPSMSYDTNRKKVVLFGGWDASGAVSDIWEWDGKTWTKIADR